MSKRGVQARPGRLTSRSGRCIRELGASNVASHRAATTPSLPPPINSSHMQSPTRIAIFSSFLYAPECSNTPTLGALPLAALPHAITSQTCKPKALNWSRGYATDLSVHYSMYIIVHLRAEQGVTIITITSHIFTMPKTGISCAEIMVVFSLLPHLTSGKHIGCCYEHALSCSSLPTACARAAKSHSGLRHSYEVHYSIISYSDHSGVYIMPLVSNHVFTQLLCISQDPKSCSATSLATDISGYTTPYPQASIT
jgi:hypothetical protein